MREHFLGYLLGALDPSECELVERHLEEHPAARRELELLSVSLTPLAADREGVAAPQGLARRTCQFVALKREVIASTQALAPVSTWQLQDLMIAAGVFLAACLLFFPAVNHSRFQARVAMCQNNLRALGSALMAYSEHNGGYFPVVPTQGNLAVAGMYAPTLVDLSYLDNSRQVVCPECPLAEQASFQVPSLALVGAATGNALSRLQRLMGGSYGYTFGYLTGENYRGHRNASRPQFALMADSPAVDQAGHFSPNHGRCGQNVLFEDGRVQFVSECQITGNCPVSGNSTCDQFFTNAAGQVAAGVHPDDAVISPSHVGPLSLLNLSSDPLEATPAAASAIAPE